MLVSQYRAIIYSQFVLLFVDLFINSFGPLISDRDVILLVVYIIQLLCLVFNLIIIFLVFFNTFVFQAGLMSLLVRKYRTAITVNVLYITISVGIHAWTLVKVWGQGSNTYIWDPPYQALYVIQRVVSVWYYYHYKRMALKLGDPRYYEDSDWLRTEYARNH